MGNIKHLLLLLVLLLFAFQCSLREDGVEDKANPFDPGGDNWSENQPPYIISDNFSASPLWQSFDFQDSTGTVALSVSALDPNQEFDTLTHYVEISSGNSSNYTQANFKYSNSAFFISSVIPDALYYLRYIVEDTWGERDTLSRSFSTPSGIPPQVPEGFSVFNQSDGIKLSWNQGSFDSVIVYRATQLKGKYMPVDTIADTSSLDTTVPDYSIFYYIIASYNEYGKNFAKDTLSGRKYNPLLQTPNEPYWDSLSANSDSIEVYWASAYYYNESYEVTGYEVFRATNPAGPYFKIGEKSASNSYEIYFADKNVTSTHNYYYKISYKTRNKGSSMLSGYVAAHLQRLPATSFINASQGAYGKYIIINWSQVSNANGYLLYRSLDPGNYYTLDDIDSVFLDTVWNSNTYTDSLTSDSIYSYHLAPFSEEHGIGSFSSYNNYGYIIRQPEATSIALKHAHSSRFTTDSTITLYWQISSYKSSYIIYRSDDNESFEPLDTIVDNDQNCYYTDTLLTKKDYKRYWYFVTVYDTVSEEESYPGDTVSGTLLPARIDPDSLEVVSYPDSVVITWEETAGAETYLIFRSSDNNSLESDFTVIDSITDTTYTIESISDSVYYYRVEPCNSTGRSVWQNDYGAEISLLTPPEEGIVSVLSPVSAAHIQLTFTGFDRADSLCILRTTDTLSGFSCIGISDTSDYYDTVTTGDTYYYTAFGLNDAGSGDTANTTSGYRASPDQTDSIYATDGTTTENNLIIVSWKSVEGAEGYQIYRSKGPYDLTGYSKIGTASENSFRDTVNSDELHYYRIKAVNIVGDGSVSDEFDMGFRRPMNVSDSVSGVSASQGYSGYIRISWTVPDSGANQNGFIVYRSESSMIEGSAETYSGSFNPIDTVGRDTNRYDDSGISVTWEDGYLYKVSSYNILGESIKSDPVWGYIQ